MSEQWAPAVEYSVAYLNYHIAFIIDDHHLPFSAADEPKTGVADIHLHYNEYFKQGTAHAIYEFELTNKTTKEKAAFSIVMCPFAAMYDAKLSSAYSTLLRATISEGTLCAKDAKFAVASRSLYSLAIEKQEQIPASEVPRIIINIGSGYFYFSSNFHALSKVFEVIQTWQPGNSYIPTPITRKYCPYCAKMSASPGAAFV